jgi:5-methyltetrahydrofolate--homocysteine methyltransferase
LTLDEARSKRLRLTFANLPKPPFAGKKVIEPKISQLREYIDWTFFFHAWELKGKFPAILDNPSHGAAARELFGHANEMLDEIERKSWLRAKGVYGFWKACADGDDIVLENGVRFPMLRQQVDHGDDKPYLSLADFVSQQNDHIGAFAVTAGLGLDEVVSRFTAEHDDYRAIMAKALADRLAEAFAEYLHEKVRSDWYDGPKLSNDELIAEKYRGIRPAFGYPACPDHSEKHKLFDLLEARSIGMDLTESGAMTPTAAVAGLYFAHPQSKYFMVGKVGKDQVEDYARRKGMTVTQAERWLRPVLGYEEVDA